MCRGTNNKIVKLQIHRKSFNSPKVTMITKIIFKQHCHILGELFDLVKRFTGWLDCGK